MRLILLGAPGVGKGTQAKLLSKHFQIPHISTGDIFRGHISEKTLIGMQVNNYLKKGLLVPDELTLSMVKERVSQDDCTSGFLLDGFPRSLYQAKVFNYMLNAKMQSIDKVLLIDLPKHVIIERITGRRFCEKCGSSFHVHYSPSRLGDRCDACGEKLLQRADDNEHIVSDRLATYYKTIKPIVDYYGTRGMLYKVQGSDSINDVFDNICSILEAV